jgi:tetratricopeptide (TPR) repeat protein
MLLLTTISQGDFMKRYTLSAALIGLLLLCFLFNGFQCGSTEMTSAKLYMQRSDWANAEVSLSKEVAKNPANAEAWYDLGYVRYQQANYDGMLDAFDQSLKAANTYQNEIAKAKLAAWGQLFNQGVAYLGSMKTAPPDSQALLSQKAVTAYKLAIKINPDSAATYQNLAAIYHNQGDTQDEIDTWKEARKRKADPTFTTFIINGYIKLAEDAKAKGDTTTANTDDQAAISELQDALKATPNNNELLGVMINLYIEMNRAKDAMPYMKQAVDNDPSNKILQNNYGILLIQTAQYDEAVAHYEAALKVDSMYSDALRNGAVAYLRVADKLKSAGSDEKGNKLYDEKKYMWNLSQATILLERFLRVKDTDPDVWEQLGQVYAKFGKIKDAEKALKKADELRGGK